MTKGGKTAVGQVASFIIEQDNDKVSAAYPFPRALLEQLEKENLTTAFNSRASSRKKDIAKYLGYIKTEATLKRNIDKVIAQLKNKGKNVRIP
jgi:uncharacterized protein YdeI (YjbR/CyaY-like superfamily)